MVSVMFADFLDEHEQQKLTTWRNSRDEGRTQTRPVGKNAMVERRHNIVRCEGAGWQTGGLEEKLPSDSKPQGQRCSSAPNPPPVDTNLKKRRGNDGEQLVETPFAHYHWLIHTFFHS